MNKPEYIIIHHTGGTDLNPKADTSYQTMEIIDAWHQEKEFTISSLGWYCGYHYVIERDGKLRQARQEYEEGVHTIEYNKRSIGVCLIGNFDSFLPTNEQILSLKILLRELVEKYKMKTEFIIPHRHFANKTCFGKKLYDLWGQDVYKLSLLEKLVYLYQKVVELIIISEKK